MTGFEPQPLPAEALLADSLLDQILRDCHPLLAEGLMMAALPQSFDVGLLGALRARNDGRDERLAERVAQFSFVERLTTTPPRFRVSPAERERLHRRFITQDGAAYRAAHGRAFDHLSGHPLPDPFSQDQALLFHELLSDPESGVRRYIATARFYITNHQLAALEKLIATARAAQQYLTLIEPPPPTLPALSDYLDLRLLQLRGRWEESIAPLQRFLADPTFPPSLSPFVRRALGLALAERGRFTDAIEAYRRALAGFTAPGDRGETMVHIGDAYRDLAVAARAHNLFPPPAPKGLARVRAILKALPSLPVFLYLAIQGINIFSASLWEAQGQQDWLLARLFGMASRWYRRANALLDPLPQLSETLLPDERLAELAQTLGDARGAARQYRALAELPEGALSDYRRAMAQLGLAKALIRQGDFEAASSVLDRAQPVLESYQDARARAESKLLHGEIALRAGRTPDREIVAHFREALDYFREQGDRLAMTEIAERLEEVAAEPGNVMASAALKGLAAQVTERSYPVRFRHSLALLFSRLSLAFVALILFAIPMVTLDPQPPTLLDLNTEAAQSITTGGDPLTLAVQLEPTGGEPPTLQLGPAYTFGLALMLAYLALQTLFGLMLILFTQTRDIEREVQREQIHLDREAIWVGEAARVPWGEITEGIGADMRLGRSLLADNSGLLLRGKNDELWIPGYTARYAELRERLAGRWPQREIGYSLLRSKMGLTYALGLLLLVGSILLNYLNAELANQPLIENYSLVQLYPFMFLLLLIPTLWWGALRPVLLYGQLDRLSPLVGWVAGSGIAVALFKLLTPGRTWVMYPSIFPAIVALGLLGAASLALWASRHAPSGALPAWRTLLRQPHPLRIPTAFRWALLGLTVLLMVPMAVVLVRDLQAYDAWVQGHASLTHALRRGDAPAALAKAEQRYQRALLIDPRHRLALQGLAAVQTNQERYAEAEQTFERALGNARNDQARAFLLTDRAAMYARWSLVVPHSPDAPTPTELRAAADADFEQAVALVGRRALGAKLSEWALLEGWLRFQAEAYDAALAHFDRAGEIGAPADEVATARGYALYKLGRYQEAHDAWSAAIDARPTSDLPYSARAVATWQIARIEEPGLCEDGAAAEATVDRLEAGLADLRRANELEPMAFTHRTVAQFHYLLRRCPGHDLVAEFDAAIESYRRATEFAPYEPFYWEMLGRLSYALSLQERVPPERVAPLRAAASEAIAESARVAALPVPEGEGRIGNTPDFARWQALVGQP